MTQTTLGRLLAEANQSSRYLAIINMSKDMRTIAITRLTSQRTDEISNIYLRSFRTQGLIN